MATEKSLMATGSVALDTLETPFGESGDVLGGSASHFCLAASHFIPTQIVGVVGTDFPDAYRDLFDERGIDTQYLDQKEGKTFSWHGRYTGPMEEAETLEVQMNVHEDFEPPFGSPAPDPDMIFLGNIAPDFQIDVLDHLEDDPPIVAADTMRLWIETERPSLTSLLERLDLLFLNYEEALLLADTDNTLSAARRIQDMGPETVIVKKGEHGAISVHGDEIQTVPGFPLEQERDPTGAGDTFAAGVMSIVRRESEITPDVLRTGMILGTIWGSFNVEHFGPEGMISLSSDQFSERLKNYASISSINRKFIEPLEQIPFRTSPPQDK